MLPLFNKTEDECETDFEKWIYVLKNMEKLDRMPYEKTYTLFKKLAEIADISNLTKEEKEKYDYSLKIIRDNNAVEKTAERRGREEGMKEGRKEGMKEGERKKQIEIARKMKQQGYDTQSIAICTSLSPEEIKQLN